MSKPATEAMESPTSSKPSADIGSPKPLRDLPSPSRPHTKRDRRNKRARSSPPAEDEAPAAKRTKATSDDALDGHRPFPKQSPRPRPRATKVKADSKKNAILGKEDDEEKEDVAPITTAPNITIPTAVAAVPQIRWVTCRGQDTILAILDEPNTSKFSVTLQDHHDPAKKSLYQYRDWTTFNWSSQAELDILNGGRDQLMVVGAGDSVQSFGKVETLEGHAAKRPRKGGKGGRWLPMPGQDISTAEVNEPDMSKFFMTMYLEGNPAVTDLRQYAKWKIFDWSSSKEITALNKVRSQWRKRKGRGARGESQPPVLDKDDGDVSEVQSSPRLKGESAAVATVSRSGIRPEYRAFENSDDEGNHDLFFGSGPGLGHASRPRVHGSRSKKQRGKISAALGMNPSFLGNVDKVNNLRRQFSGNW